LQTCVWQRISAECVSGVSIAGLVPRGCETGGRFGICLFFDWSCCEASQLLALIAFGAFALLSLAPSFPKLYASLSLTRSAEQAHPFAIGVLVRSLSSKGVSLRFWCSSKEGVHIIPGAMLRRSFLAMLLHLLPQACLHYVQGHRMLWPRFRHSSAFRVSPFSLRQGFRLEDICYLWGGEGKGRGGRRLA
jgi:hypothetical protein